MSRPKRSLRADRSPKIIGRVNIFKVYLPGALESDKLNIIAFTPEDAKRIAGELQGNDPEDYTTRIYSKDPFHMERYKNAALLPQFRPGKARARKGDPE